ncbi:hypothetical protein vBAfQDWS535_06 [Alcaligenes phage vB_Af_QDWS535]|nr:hypothetical protein vBAfQDWS535_06 [Alcaligenes phage vB_Af_QDWS535]
MANVSRVQGFRPVKSGLGAAWNAQLTRYYIPATNATAIGVGDLVKLSGDADVRGIPAVAKAAVGDACIGAVVQFDFDMENLNTPQYAPANTERYVYVADDPQTVYEVQVSGGTLTATDVGKNADFVDAGINPVTGVSGETVDATTLANTATLALKVMSVVQTPDNEIGTDTKVLVKINQHQLANGSAGV